MQELIQSITLKNEFDCTGCGACIATCKQGAISKKHGELGVWIPQINISKCINCGQCERVCKEKIIIPNESKKAYIAYNRDCSTRKDSASGGAFSAIASYILDIGGVVFGSELSFEKGKVNVEHVKISRKDQLYRILGSKYVQSDCDKAYCDVKKCLDADKRVLFCGCSCQIEGLYRFLKNTKTDNLITMDLICHGTPGNKFFYDYVDFLQKKYKGNIIRFSFRKKMSKILYRIYFDICIDNNIKTIEIPMRKSAYYRLFLQTESYRNSCYECKYATLNKPSDITVGDYFEAKKDYPMLFEGNNAISFEGGLSSVIVHTTKGFNVLNNAPEYIRLIEVDPLRVQQSHWQLRHKSVHTDLRNKIKRLYKKGGYPAVEKWNTCRNFVIALPRFLINLKNKFKSNDDMDIDGSGY